MQKVAVIHHPSEYRDVNGAVNQIIYIIYFHSVDPYRITKSIWIWK